MSAFPYQYAALRAVPRVEREEFVNVGVVLYCQAFDLLKCRWRLDEARLRALHPGLDLLALRRRLEALEQVCVDGRGAGAAGERLGTRFGWLTAPRSTVLQPGPVHGGVAADPRAETDRLLRMLTGG